MSPSARRIGLFSLITNAILVTFYLLYRNMRGARRTADIAGKLGTENRRDIIFPEHVPAQSRRALQTARLTDVVIPFPMRQEENLYANLDLWRKFPPCADAPHPQTKYNLKFYLSGQGDEDLEKRVLAEYGKLPFEAVRDCFDRVTVKSMGLSGASDSYLVGSRLQFEYMLSGALFLDDAAKKQMNVNDVLSPMGSQSSFLAPPWVSHVLYMEPDLRPVSRGWLWRLDETTRYPANEPFWIKGSSFRGSMHAITQPVTHNLMHINGNALYNVGSGDCYNFYAQHIRPALVRGRSIAGYDAEFFRIILQSYSSNDEISTSWMRAQKYLSKLVFTNTILNMWHSSWTQAKIAELSSNRALLVHGGHPGDLQARTDGVDQASV